MIDKRTNHLYPRGDRRQRQGPSRLLITPASKHRREHHITGRSNATPDTKLETGSTLIVTLCGVLEARIRRANPASNATPTTNVRSANSDAKINNRRFADEPRHQSLAATVP